MAPNVPPDAIPEVEASGPEVDTSGPEVVASGPEVGASKNEFDAVDNEKNSDTEAQEQVADVGKLTSGIKSLHELRSECLEDTRTNSFVVIVAIAAALGGMVFGYDIGGAGATFLMQGFKIHFGWECAPDDVDCVPASTNEINTDKGLINGLFGAGAAIGAMVAPLVFDGMGRKICMYGASWTFILGAALQAAAVNMPMLYIPRLLSGFGIGALSMCSPVYITELAPEHRRGQLGTLWQVAITTGIVTVSIANIWLADWSDGWRISYGGNVLFALILIGMLSIMPESPRWLLAQDRLDDAKAALLMVRFPDQMDREMEIISLEVQEEREAGIATWAEVFSQDNKMRYRVYLGCALQSIQQLSGINAIMFYAPQILSEFFGDKGGIYGALALNVVNFFSTFITIATIDRFGRVKLLFSGAIIMCIALVPNAILASMEQTNTVGVFVVIFCALYVIGFAYSWGPIVWVVCAEMYPLRERGKATGLSTFTNWFWTTIVGAVFPSASEASLTGCFGFFAGVVFVATFFTYFYLPETANRNMLEIDEEFKNHKPQHPRKKWT